MIKIILHFHHIGIISKDIEKSKYWVKRTHQVSHETDIIFDPKQKVTLCLISCENGIKDLVKSENEE